MPRSARSEIQRSLPARPAEQPNSGFRRMEIPASRLESATTRQPHMRPQLCKHCAALARRRSYRSSLFPAGNLSHKRFEARIAAKIVEEWISREEEQVAFVASRKAVLERFNGPFFF